LILALEGLDEGLLGEILGIRDVPDDAVNLDEDTPQVLGNKSVLPVQELQARLDNFAHQTVNDRFHRFLN